MNVEGKDEPETEGAAGAPLLARRRPPERNLSADYTCTFIYIY